MSIMSPFLKCLRFDIAKAGIYGFNVCWATLWDPRWQENVTLLSRYSPCLGKITPGWKADIKLYLKTFKFLRNQSLWM